MGYIAHTSMPAASTPSATAVLPLMTTWGSVSPINGMSKQMSRFSSAQRYPASKSSTLGLMTFSPFLRNFCRISSYTSSLSRE